MTFTAEARDIADSLIQAMQPDCGPALFSTEEQDTRLRTGVTAMLAAGIDFTEEVIDAIADGDIDAAQTRFGDVPGYSEVMAALRDVFDNEPEAA